MVKTITMDYEEYEQELACHSDMFKREGANKALYDVMKFLESDLTLRDFLTKTLWIDAETVLKEGPYSNWHWVKIAKAVNRPIE